MCRIFDKNRNSFSLLIFNLLFVPTFLFIFIQSSQAVEADSDLSFLTSTERQWLQEHPTINLAPDPEFLPIEFIDENGNYKGIAADYVRLIEKKLGIKFNILKFNSWAEILEKTEKRENDMWGAATPTPQRLRYMLFTQPLIKLPSIILVKKNVDKSLDSIDSFKGMRVAVIQGYAIHDYLTKQYPNLKIDAVPDIQTGLKKVSFGLVDAMAVNIALATYYIEKEGIANLRIAGEVGYVNNWALASRSDWPTLNIILDKALAQISETERKKIYRKWVGIRIESGFSLREFLILFFSAAAVFGIIGIVVWNASLKQQVQARTIELNKKNEELNDANSAKSVFLANMSHEIRTPMNAILGYAQILERDDSLNRDQKDSLRNVLSSGNHLLNLINEILDLSKIEAGRMELNLSDFDLKEICKDMSAMFDLRCKEKNLTWNNNGLLETSAWVVGDETKLRQVLINLLGNAVKFTDYGEVSLSLNIEPNDFYTFEVFDSGAGIPEEVQKKIFEPFKQDYEGATKGGTGLGLAISKKQVELMGSNLQVDSEMGKGSRFYFSVKLLPAIKQSGTKEVEKYKNVKSLAQRYSLKILVVDDVKENREVLKKFLQGLNIKIELAENGKIATEKVQSESYDLVFMDLRMPIMDGLQACIFIKNVLNKKNLKVVGLSASVYDYSTEQVQSAGFDDFLLKPFKTEEIIGCIDKLLSLEWESENKESSSHAPAIQKSDFSNIQIPEKLYVNLKESAADFNLTKFSEALKELEQMGTDGQWLASEFIDCLKTYDFISIQQTLEEVNKNR